MAQRKMLYIRTDKNGTEIWQDYTCNRCGGVGGADAWAYTGWKCYKCGGTGEMEKPEIIKKYTPEYRAKLDAQREKRAEKKAQELRAKAGELNKAFYEAQGFNAEGFCWVVLGNTYEIRAELKESGARFNYDLGWYFNSEPENHPSIKIHASEYYRENEYGLYRWNDVNYGEAVDTLKAKIKNANKSDENQQAGGYVGEAGDKLELNLTYVRKASWESRFGYYTETQYCYTFKDEAGNVVVWKTTSLLNLDEGAEVMLKGTVKAQDEYKGTKQTVMQRCKVTAK